MYFTKNPQCIISRKSIQWDARCSMWMDGWTWQSYGSFFATLVTVPKNKYKFVNKMTTNHTYHSQLTQCPLYQIYLKTTISNIILVQSCTIHININLNSRPGMQQVYENNHTLVLYHERFCYTHIPDISSLSTKILLTVKRNEVQQTLMSMFQLSLLFALTLNDKNKKHLSICSSL